MMSRRMIIKRPFHIKRMNLLCLRPNNNKIRLITITCVAIVLVLSLSPPFLGSVKNSVLFSRSRGVPCKTQIMGGSTSTSLSCTSDDVHLPDLTSFAYNLFFSLVTGDEVNVVISPLSIAAALALVLAGTTVESIAQTEIQSVLNINTHSEIPLLSNVILSSSKNGRGKSSSSSSSSSFSGGGVDLSIANGIWTHGDIKPEFVQLAQTIHSAAADSLPQTYDPINDFVSDKTKGMIKDILQGNVDPLTRAILVNAIYFKGKWKEKFDESKTKKGLFYANINTNTNDGENSSGKIKIEERDAMFMKATREFNVGIDIPSLGGADAVLLEYGEDEDKDEEAEFGALFMLPSQSNESSMQEMISGLESYMNIKKTPKTKITAPPLHKLLENELSKQKIDLILPRFRISYGAKSLKSNLVDLGIKAPFNSNDMFHQMSDDPLLHLDDVYHTSLMEVTEEGTVAAAATAAIMMTRSLPPPVPKLNFNRPFVVILLHISTGLPLFIGKIDDPELMF